MIFSNNTAEQGGALYFDDEPHAVMFHRNTYVKFVNNRATEGGAVYLSQSTASLVTFKRNAVVDFCNNSASLRGSAISLHENSNIWFKEDPQHTLTTI